MKREKNTLTKFGKLIHKYTIQDGVEDGAIVPLIYEMCIRDSIMVAVDHICVFSPARSAARRCPEALYFHKGAASHGRFPVFCIVQTNRCV